MSLCLDLSGTGCPTAIWGLPALAESASPHINASGFTGADRTQGPGS
jgi:hypothetical protein